MDKILEFINNKTNNKYKNLLFFDAVYNSQNTTMQIAFKKTNEIAISSENTSELTLLCKQFLGDLVKSVVIVFKTDNLTLAEFKDIVKQLISNSDVSGVDLNNIGFDFDKTTTTVSVPVAANIDDENKTYLKQDLETKILEKTGKQVNLNFDIINNNQTDVLELRKERILEDNKIYEQIKQSQVVTFKKISDLYNKVSNTNGILAGSDIGGGNVIVVGKIKSVVERLRQVKNDTEKEDENAENKKASKYLTIELENDGTVTKCVLFLKKDAETPALNVGDSIAVEGTVSEFRGSKDIRIKSIAKCEFEPPKQIWRSKPTTYRFVKPEPYQSFEQSNFFIIEEDTKCEYLKNNTFVVYDLETTGINPDTNDIIDIGAFKIVNGKITEKFATFVNPMRDIPEEASKINHITNSMVENSPTIEQVLPDFYNFCYGSIIVGYNNIGFDDFFIKKEGKKQLYNFDNKRDDVMLLAKTHLKGLKNYRLGTVCNELAVPLIDAHRATNDALATAKLFIKIVEKFM